MKMMKNRVWKKNQVKKKVMKKVNKVKVKFLKKKNKRKKKLKLMNLPQAKTKVKEAKKNKMNLKKNLKE